MIKNGNQNEPEKNGKPKYSIHDFKEKKNYTREEMEKMKLGAEFMEVIRESLKKNEQTEKSSI